jgi:hypothetical protein
MNRLRRPGTLLIALLAVLLPYSHAHAFDLQALSAQLEQPAVVRGEFVQEKHLRALPMPLTSRGRFVLAREHGLLWHLQQPLQQDYRISAHGISRRGLNGWQANGQPGAASQQNRLFLAVLAGDTQGLQRDFELSLSGTATDWHLELTPRGLLLRQIFSAIHIQGGATVESIDLLEVQGDRTHLRLVGSQLDGPLSTAERHDFRS